MKQYNTSLPQDNMGFLESEELEDMFAEPESIYGHGNKLSMRKHVSGTKKKVYQEWGRYHSGKYWRKMSRKLATYLGWNVDKARSDFYRWCKENRIPSDINIADQFDQEFGIGSTRHYYYSDYIIGDDKIIRKAPMKPYELNKYHKKFFRNVGHQLLGYRINPELIKHQEMIDVLISVFGKKIIPAIGGGLIDTELFGKWTSVYTDKISYKFDELYGTRRVWMNGKHTDVPGKYWKPEYGRYGKSMGSIFEAVYSPDIWERKSKEELDAEWRSHMTDKARHKDRPKARKKASKAHYDQVYEEGILKAKGIAARSAAENLVAIERHGFTKDSFKAFGGQPNLK